MISPDPTTSALRSHPFLSGSTHQPSASAHPSHQVAPGPNQTRSTLGMYSMPLYVCRETGEPSTLTVGSPLGHPLVPELPSAHVRYGQTRGLGATTKRHFQVAV